MTRKKYNFETDFHIHSPKEYPLMSVSKDNQYMMAISYEEYMQEEWPDWMINVK